MSRQKSLGLAIGSMEQFEECRELLGWRKNGRGEGEHRETEGD